MRKLALLFLAACSTSEPELETEQAIQWGRCTDEDFCGTNSPLMTVYGVWEFHIRGAYNLQGWRVLGLGKENLFYGFEVVDSRIVGKDIYGNVAIEGQDLAGARIYLEIKGQQSAIEIVDVGAVPEVVGKGTKVETYVLDWGFIAKNPLPGPMWAGGMIEANAIPVRDNVSTVCAPPSWYGSSHVSSPNEWDETVHAGMSPYQAVVFEGDRFDPTTRTVDPKADNEWFNIGCGTSTLAKLRLTRHTINTAPKWELVQAALKMLGGDYCGTGRAFTLHGEELVWRSVAGMDYLRLAPQNTLDARWDENGALCINEPRMLVSDNPDAAAVFPDLWKMIDGECNAVGKSVQLCNNTNTTKWDGELVTSVNYE